MVFFFEENISLHFSQERDNPVGRLLTRPLRWTHAPIRPTTSQLIYLRFDIGVIKGIQIKHDNMM